MIRHKLNILAEDFVNFDINEAGEVVLHKAELVDMLFLQFVSASLGEKWNSKEDSVYDTL